MDAVEYPRPAKQPRVADPTAGFFVVLMAFVPVLGALETMFVGEELSVLGDRLHRVFGDDYARSTLVALVALGLCGLRIPIGVALARGARVGYVAFASLAIPFTIVDIASSFALAGVVAVAFNLLIALRCVGRLRARASSDPPNSSL